MIRFTVMGVNVQTRCYIWDAARNKRVATFDQKNRDAAQAEADRLNKSVNDDARQIDLL
jgi:hypothetical protein